MHLFSCYGPKTLVTKMNQDFDQNQLKLNIKIGKMIKNNKFYQINGTSMIIQRLQECLKAKKKNPCPQPLLEILNSLNQQQSYQISLTQKGVILQILAKFCYIEHQLLYNTLNDLKDSLYCGKFDPTEKTTKKRRTSDKKQITTTRRKKHENIENPRTQMNLDQLLQRELSSPNNTEPRSQNSQISSKIRLPLDFISMEKLQEPYNRSQDFITPIKQSQEPNKFDEYRNIINISNKNTTKIKTKSTNQQTTATRTRKKNTQQIPQQINTNISLEMLSQLSIKREIQQILELTKKKKNKDKENLYHHQVFDTQNHSNYFHIFDNRQTISKFNKDFTNKYSKEKIFNEDHGYLNLLEDLEKYEDQNFEGRNLKFQGRKQDLEKLVEEELIQTKKVKFNKFANDLQISQQDKSILFYSMLCSSDSYKMEQREIEKFGQITISLC